MHSWTFLNIQEQSGTLWNILEHAACILEHSGTFCMHSGTFWNFLHAFWIILELSACILEHSGTFCMHSGTFWKILEHAACILEHSGTLCMHSGTLCMHSWTFCMHSDQLTTDRQTHTQTHGHTDIRTCRAASSQLTTQPMRKWHEQHHNVRHDVGFLDDYKQTKSNQ